jgi:hypothetical protein
MKWTAQKRWIKGSWQHRGAVELSGSNGEKTSAWNY